VSDSPATIDFQIQSLMLIRATFKISYFECPRTGKQAAFQPLLLIGSSVLDFELNQAHPRGSCTY
jgi:hypothetical protein